MVGHDQPTETGGPERAAGAVTDPIHRARARLDEVAPTPESVSEPAEPGVRALLDRYSPLSSTVTPPRSSGCCGPTPRWSCRPPPLGPPARMPPSMRSPGLGVPGEWRMVPTAANGQPAAATYRRWVFTAFALPLTAP